MKTNIQVTRCLRGRDTNWQDGYQMCGMGTNKRGKRGWRSGWGTMGGMEVGKRDGNLCAAGRGYREMDGREVMLGDEVPMF